MTMQTTTLSSGRSGYRAELGTACEGLLSTLFHQAAAGDGRRGLAIAVTSPLPGAGVSRIAQALADSLGHSEEGVALAVECRSLDSAGSAARSACNEHISLQNTSSEESDRAGLINWHCGQTGLASHLEDLRLRYRYLLIDCPSLKETYDIVRLAPLVDGIVLIVEANRTQRDHLLHAERVINAAHGRILGHVLNKRSYPVPQWVHKKMDSLGI